MVAVVVPGADEVLELDENVLEQDKEMALWFIITIAKSQAI